MNLSNIYYAEKMNELRTNSYKKGVNRSSLNAVSDIRKKHHLIHRF